MPDEETEYEKYHSCAAHVSNVWLKDIEIAKTNNTLSDVTVTIRDPLSEKRITNEMYFVVEGSRYRDENGDAVKFDIKSVQPDYEDSRFMIIIGEVVV